MSVDQKRVVDVLRNHHWLLQGHLGWDQSLFMLVFVFELVFVFVFELVFTNRMIMDLIRMIDDENPPATRRGNWFNNPSTCKKSSISSSLRFCTILSSVKSTFPFLRFCQCRVFPRWKQNIFCFFKFRNLCPDLHLSEAPIKRDQK